MTLLQTLLEAEGFASNEYKILKKQYDDARKARDLASKQHKEHLARIHDLATKEAHRVGLSGPEERNWYSVKNPSMQKLYIPSRFAKQHDYYFIDNNVYTEARDLAVEARVARNNEKSARKRIKILGQQLKKHSGAPLKKKQQLDVDIDAPLTELLHTKQQLWDHMVRVYKVLSVRYKSLQELKTSYVDPVATPHVQVISNKQMHQLVDCFRYMEGEDQTKVLLNKYALSFYLHLTGMNTPVKNLEKTQRYAKYYKELVLDLFKTWKQYVNVREMILVKKGTMASSRN